jgi:hypothetical protein
MSATAEIYPTNPLYWTCTACLVGRGQPCRTGSGRKATGHHRNRIEAVALWQRYGAGYSECTAPDSHNAHLASNGSCPWCGGTERRP